MHHITDPVPVTTGNKGCTPLFLWLLPSSPQVYEVTVEIEGTTFMVYRRYKSRVLAA